MGDTDSIEFSRKNQSFIVLGSGTAGIYLIDISDLQKPFIISNIRSKGESVEKVCISSDDLYVYAVCRDYGIFIYNIENRKLPYIISQNLMLSGAEYI